MELRGGMMVEILQPNDILVDKNGYSDSLRVSFIMLVRRIDHDYVYVWDYNLNSEYRLTRSGYTFTPLYHNTCFRFWQVSLNK